jgi:hypothetical protein
VPDSLAKQYTDRNQAVYVRSKKKKIVEEPEEVLEKVEETPTEEEEVLEISDSPPEEKEEVPEEEPDAQDQDSEEKIEVKIKRPAKGKKK